MSDSLRSKVIRLAHANPSLRPHLLPLLAGSVRVAAGEQDEKYDEDEYDEAYRDYLDMLKYFNTLTREDDEETKRVLGSWDLDPQYVLRFRTAKGWGPVMDAVMEPLLDTHTDHALDEIIRNKIGTPEGAAFFGKRNHHLKIVMRWLHANVGKMKSFARDQVGY